MSYVPVEDQAPLLLYRAATDEVESLNVDAPPMGLLPAVPVLPAPPLSMEPGDVYAPLSDGFYEASTPPAWSSARTGSRRSCASTGGPGRRRLAALRATLREFTGDAPLDDDRTAVMLRPRRQHLPPPDRRQGRDHLRLLRFVRPRGGTK